MTKQEISDIVSDLVTDASSFCDRDAEEIADWIQENFVEKFRKAGKVTVREACRRRMALGGVDAEALEHALTQLEAENERLRKGVEEVVEDMERSIGSTVWIYLSHAHDKLRALLGKGE